MSVGDLAGTAELAGTGQPGAVIIVNTPAGPATTTVPADGNWAISISGLRDGINVIGVNHTTSGCAAGRERISIVSLIEQMIHTTRVS